MGLDSHPREQCKPGAAVQIKPVFKVGPEPSKDRLQISLSCVSSLSPQNCSHPINYLSSPRNTTSWETGKLSPAAESALSSPVQKDPPVKNITNKGKEGCHCCWPRLWDETTVKHSQGVKEAVGNSFFSFWEERYCKLQPVCG